MKCAICLSDYMRDAHIEKNLAPTNAWTKVNAAETVVDGTAYCRDHMPQIVMVDE